MRTRDVLIGLAASTSLLIVVACTAPVVVPTPPPSIGPPPLASVSTVGQPLLPDPAAEFTVGDTVPVSDGESDQANLVVLEAVMLPPGAGGTQYAFLVEITGLDPLGIHYNVLNFSLFDDQSFEYQALPAGGQEPRLEFGDLSGGRSVRGWLTFAGPTQSAFLELEYAPAFAPEAVHVRVLVP